LSTSISTWRVVYFHHAPYSSSSNHGSQEYMQWPFKEWGADVVIAANDHTYERLVIDDFPYFVNGLGGKSKYLFGSPIPGSQVRYNEKYGAMLMTANETRLTFSFFSVDSELIDFYEIILPNAPTNLADTVVSQTQIDLSWQDNSNNEDGFTIERRLPPSATWTEISTLGADVTTYQDTGLTANTGYCYKVRAYNTEGNSGYSNEDCTTTNPTIPTSPSNLTAEATGVNEVTLSWTDNSNHEDGFIIERENITLPVFAVIDSVGANDTSYIDSTISQGVSYNYRISAFNISGLSGYSNVYYVTTILPTPTNLVSSLFGGPPYYVVLNWQESSINELGFVIERDTVGLGSFETLDSVAANVTFYEDTNFVNPVDTFYYRIYAFSQDTVSEYSNIAEMIIPVELVSFTANVFENSVTLSWTTATEVNNLGFEIERRIEDGQFSTIGYVEGHGTTTEKQNYQFIDNISDIQSTSLSYRLKQIDFDGSYEYSDVVEVTNLAPTDFALHQNYPNPFNPVTTIIYSLPVKSQVELIIYNTLGEIIEQLVNEEKEPGRYEVKLNASNLPSGIYFYRLRSGSFVETKKIILMK
ncbi:MAG: fibronectin type III domain-containing protein, partial [Ignavibacteriaceae bacterium]